MMGEKDGKVFRGLIDVDIMTPAIQAARERLGAAEAELADARAALIETHNRERAKERTRTKLRVLDGGAAA